MARASTVLLAICSALLAPKVVALFQQTVRAHGLDKQFEAKTEVAVWASTMTSAFARMEHGAEALYNRTGYWQQMLKGPQVKAIPERPAFFSEIAVELIGEAASAWHEFGHIFEDVARSVAGAVNASQGPSPHNLDPSVPSIGLFVSQLQDIKALVGDLGKATGVPLTEGLDKLHRQVTAADQLSNAMTQGMLTDIQLMFDSLESTMGDAYPGQFIEGQQKALSGVLKLITPAQELVRGVSNGARLSFPNELMGLPEPSLGGLWKVGAAPAQAGPAPEFAPQWVQTGTLLDEMRDAASTLAAEMAAEKSTTTALQRWPPFESLMLHSVSGLTRGPINASYAPFLALEKKAALAEALLKLELFVRTAAATLDVQGDGPPLPPAAAEEPKLAFMEPFERELHDVVMKVTDFNTANPSFCMGLEQKVFSVVDAVTSAGQALVSLARQ